VSSNISLLASLVNQASGEEDLISEITSDDNNMGYLVNKARRV